MSTSITFEDLLVIDFSFSLEEDIQENDFQIKFDPIYFEDKKTKFAVDFRVKIKIQNKSLIKVHVLGIFETNEEIDEDFKKTSFPRTNAAAIAYPFVRALISNFMLNAGHEPVSLPSLNFGAILKNIEDE